MEQVLDKIWLGDVKDAEGLFLDSHGIHTVLSIAGHFYPHNPDLDYVNEDFLDSEIADKQWIRLVNRGVDAVESGRPLMVHCLAGSNRSASILSSVLVRLGKFPTFDAAIEFLHSKRPCVHPNPYLRNMCMKLLGEPFEEFHTWSWERK